MRMRSILLAGLGVLALCTCNVWADDDPIDTFQTFFTDLDSLKVTRTNYTTFTFRAQFHELGDLYESFYTVFSPCNYLNFSAWDYEAHLWKREAYCCPFPFLYVANYDAKLKEKLLSLKKYDRFEATGEIRSTFDGMPWIQILSIKKLDGRHSKKSIHHLGNGFDYKRKGDYVNAMIEFTAAHDDSLPDSVKALLHKEEGIFYFLEADYRKASRSFWKAVWLMDEPDEETEYYAKKATLLWESRAGLRMNVAETQIVDHMTAMIRSGEDLRPAVAVETTSEQPEVMEEMPDVETPEPESTKSGEGG